MLRPIPFLHVLYFFLLDSTVKPFNLSALNFGDFTCRIILAPFILANSDHMV